MTTQKSVKPRRGRATTSRTAGGLSAEPADQQLSLGSNRFRPPVPVTLRVLPAATGPEVDPVRLFIMREPDQADWEIWSRMETAKLWQVVSLTLGLSPDCDPALIKWPEVFEQRLRIAVNAVLTNVLAAERTAETRNSVVRLRQFAAWAVGKNIDLPPIFPGASDLTAFPGGRTLSKQEMITAHSKNWPTVEADIGEASRNGLGQAKTGSRRWNERQALAWAERTGRWRTSVEKPTAADPASWIPRGSPRKHRR